MLAGAITGSPVTGSATKNAAGSISGNLSNGTPFTQLIAPDITSPTGTAPKAYLNIVFFDERFTFVPESSSSVRVGAANTPATLALLNLRAPKNGYVYIYLSNESDESVPACRQAGSLTTLWCGMIGAAYWKKTTTTVLG